ncbi:hypothetical protein [Tenacibaculum sp. Ill]|uniref:hypothetical protein n=1 Tax=Tenacibaculum sp. Ill TaxID=3445935 RepID=UPI003F7B1519
MSKSDKKLLLNLLGGALAIVAIYKIFSDDDRKKRRKKLLENDGFDSDRKKMSNDFENIKSDLISAKEKL